MKIGIDGFEANTSQRVGIGQYAFQLLKMIYEVDTANEYTIFLPAPPLSDLPPKRQGWKYKVGKPGVLWTVLKLPGLIKQVNLDLFFSPTHYLPWVTLIPKILSIMDLSYLHFPEMFMTKDLLQLKYMGLYSIKRARKILTISEFTKKDIIEHYNYPENDIVVTYPGVNIKYEISRPQAGRPLAEKLKKKYDLDDYILFVGTIQPRKNISRLIDAFDLLKFRGRLVLVGKRGWLEESIFKKIKNAEKKDKIVYLDFVSGDELGSLYQHAKCLVLPSLYEGFGLPVVEAMSYSCPVVISNTTGLPEVAGEAGIYVDPLNVEDIARGLMKALQLSLKEREILLKKGQEQIKKFTWDNCARRTIEVLNSLKNGSSA